MTAIKGGETLMGIAGAHGVAVARAVVFSASRAGFPLRRVKPEQVVSEWKRFEDAVGEVQADLRRVLGELDEQTPEASILEAYVLMVGDETLAQRVHGNIHERRRCADWAVADATEALAARLGSVDDPYMRERSHDVEFVGERLLRALGNMPEPSGVPGLDLSLFPASEPVPSSQSESVIVVAHDLSPADTAAMIGSRVVGFITEVGSRTSHTAIMARALAIPAVLGVNGALAHIVSGDLVVVDGLRGRVIVDPTAEQLEEADRRVARYQALALELGQSRDRAAITKDDVAISILANIELPDEADVAVAHGAEGVGLYRTEFLYVNRLEPPSEEEQLAVFRRVMDSMKGKQVTLRSFDIGGDKFATTFRLPRELNPMLGLRAVRLALVEREVFLTQLRAMLRASAFGDVRIMIPLVSSVSELRRVRTLLDEARAQLLGEGHPFARSLSLGVMIEVPAAAIMAKTYAAEADFMSIGTNDLVQYALAVDRTNRALAHLASPYDPAILHLIDGVIRAGRDAGCPVSICGEMASEIYGAALLLGLGLRELSMESVAIPEVKEAIRRVRVSELEQLAAEALTLATATEVEQLLESALESRFHDLLTGQPDSLPERSRSSSA
jgi:phosphotransferase system enzyme I (PtsI)